jgi:hypothetical protein
MTVEALVETFPWVDIDLQWFPDLTACPKGLIIKAYKEQR